MRPYLADTSVWSKVRSHPNLSGWFNDAVRAGHIVTCDIVVLELLRSARNTANYREQSLMLTVLDRCPIREEEFERALEVQALLGDRGQHRGVPPADLLIAAAGESAAMPILHYDHDYDLISKVSGQETVWFVPAGSLP